MRRFPLSLLLIVGIVGAAIYYGKIDVSQWESWLKPSPGGASLGADPGPTAGRIRIAAYNIQVFGETKMAQPEVVRVLADVVRRFDIVAVQEIRSRKQDVLPKFLEAVNAGGGAYDYVIGPRVGRSTSTEQYAYIYNTATVEVDPQVLYTVNDPDDLLHREPLVTSFRARGTDSQSAFTFTLINIHTDPDEVTAELAVLDDVFAAVRGDGRQEDDVILLGDFNANEQQLASMMGSQELYAAIIDVPTNARGTKGYDNLVFSRRATTEFSGRAGVLDVMREFNLTSEQVLAVSDHLPVWAEFELKEGGRPGRVAAGVEVTR